MRRFLIAVLLTAVAALAVVVSMGPRNPTGFRVTDAANASPTIVPNTTRPAAARHPAAPAVVRKAAVKQPAVAARPATTWHPTPRKVVHQVFTPAPARTVVAAASSADSCSTALAYLAAHSAPGFSFECPGYAIGHQAMTCINEPGICAGEKIIVLNVVCPASYMNEASNSWVLVGLAHTRIDPYGYCH